MDHGENWSEAISRHAALGMNKIYMWTELALGILGGVVLG